MASDTNKCSLDNKDYKILCVDDEEALLEIIAETVSKAGFTPVTMTNPEEAILYFKSEINDIALIISDFKMGTMNGFDFRRAILPAGKDVPFIVISAYTSKEMALEGLELKISGFFDKPFDEKKIIDNILKESASRVQNLKEYQAIQKTFIEEATAILETVEEALLFLERDRTNLDTIKVIAREIHTLKGSSGCLSVNTVTKYVHKYEDIIAAIQKGGLEFTDYVYDILFIGFDRIKELILSVTEKKLHNYKLETLLLELDLKAEQNNHIKAKIDQSVNSAQQNPTISSKKESSVKQGIKESISVPIVMLDELSNYSGEITVLRNMINKIVRSLEVQYTGNKDIQSLSELLDEMHKINGTIQLRITDLRKIPLSQSIKNIPRMVHDLCHDLGKQVNLDIEGENLRVDNSLAMVCSNSILHLVRNSIDHGIEPAQDRLRAGKREAGTIYLKCFQDHEEIHIKIKDDGNGIDFLKIKAKALEKSLYSEYELSKMSEKQILGIIFSSGFSTAAKVTNVSGRGVGMDMVKSSVESVGGQIDIDTKIGVGTTFTLKLPIPRSVLIINSLLVESSHRCFAIPQDSITRVLRIENDQIQSALFQVSTGTILRWDNKIYPVLNLKTVLKLNDSDEIHPNHQLNKSVALPTVLEVLIVRSDNLLYALLVDSILDSEEIVVKGIQSYFNIHGIYTGATFMGDGTIGLILDIKGIADYAGISSTLSQDMDSNKNNLIKKELHNSIVFKNYLLFNLNDACLYGVILDQVFRIEEIDQEKIQYSGSQSVYIYRDKIMPIYSLDSILNIKKIDKKITEINPNKVSIIVTNGKFGLIAFKVFEVVDIIESSENVSDTIRDRIGIMGNLLLRDKTLTILDFDVLLQIVQNKKLVAESISP